MEDPIAISLTYFLAILSVTFVLLCNFLLCCSIYCDMKTSKAKDKKDPDLKSTIEKATQTSEIRNYEEIVSNDPFRFSNKQKEDPVKEHIKKLIRQKSNDNSGKLGSNSARIGPMEDIIFKIV